MRATRCAAFAVILLAGCDQKSATAEMPDAAGGLPTASVPGEMGGMAMPASEPKPVKSTGTVTAIDKAGGKITLDHQPIPEVSWPAMKMTFSVKPGLLAKVAVGDKVAFDATIAGNAGEVIAVTKQ